MSEDAPHAGGRPDVFKTAVSVLIALTALTGALLSWKAARINGAAGAGDADAIQAALHRAYTEMTVSAEAVHQRSAFQEYQLHLLLSRLAKNQAQSDPGAPGSLFDDWQREIMKAAVRRDALDQDYLEREGEEERFDEDRYREAFRAEAVGRKATDPGPFIRRAEAARARVRAVVSLNMLLAAALFFFTLSLKTAKPGRRVWAAAGLAIFSAALGLGLWRLLG